MEIVTHQSINQELCGKPVKIDKNKSEIEYLTRPEMAVDDSGLVHGGFIFGLADYAAMIAVNHPNVVLGSADVKFTKPVKVNETVHASAEVTACEGKKHLVAVEVHRGKDMVFKGEFACFVLDKHVLAE